MSHPGKQDFPVPPPDWIEKGWPRPDKKNIWKPVLIIWSLIVVVAFVLAVVNMLVG